jgi:TPR repeat protein
MEQLENISLAEIAADPDQESAWLYALYLRGDLPEDEEEGWLKQAAELGIVPAMHDYAEFLELDGRLEDAERWFQAAAEHGSPEALYQMGLIHDERRDFDKGEQCYRRAAEQGFLPAMCDLGRRLARRRDPEAKYWFGRCDQAGYLPWDDSMTDQNDPISEPPPKRDGK